MPTARPHPAAISTSVVHPTATVNWTDRHAMRPSFPVNDRTRRDATAETLTAAMLALLAGFLPSVPPPVQTGVPS